MLMHSLIVLYAVFHLILGCSYVFVEVILSLHMASAIGL